MGTSPRVIILAALLGMQGAAALAQTPSAAVDSTSFSVPSPQPTQVVVPSVMPSMVEVPPAPQPQVVVVPPAPQPQTISVPPMPTSNSADALAEPVQEAAAPSCYAKSAQGTIEPVAPYPDQSNCLIYHEGSWVDKNGNIIQSQ